MKINLKVNKSAFIAYSISFLFALIISLIDFDNLKPTQYIDRAVYQNQIDYVPNRLTWFDFDSYLSYVTNEWLWHKIIEISTDFFMLSSAQIFFFISFFTLLFASLIILKSTNYKYIGILFLLNPIFVDFVFSQLRLSLAITFLYISFLLYQRNSKLFLLILLPTPFIHTSTVLFIGMLASAIMLERSAFINRYFKIIFSILVGFAVALVTGPLMSSILASIEDRRSEYNDMSSPFLYMIFWVALFIYFVFKGLSEGVKRDFYYYASLMVLSIVFFNLFFSGYSSRFLAAFFPIVIIAMLTTKGVERPFISLMYIFFTVFLWFFWAT